MSYFERAVLELVMLSLLSGIVGTWIVLRRRAFFTVALSHATFPGGVIAAAVGAHVLLGQAIAALLLVPIMGLLSRVKDQGSQVSSGVVLAFGFALGALLASLQTAIRVPVEALLVGHIFGVDRVDLTVTATVLALACVLSAIFWRQLTFETFDPVGFGASGFRRSVPEVVTAFLVVLTVVAAMPAVGAILAVALVVGPAATAHLIASNLRAMIPLATVIGLTASGMGLWASWAFGVAAGGAIGVAIAILHGGALIVQRLRGRDAVHAVRRSTPPRVRAA